MVIEQPWLHDSKIKLPPGHTEIVVGDIHGKIHLLQQLIDYKEEYYPNATLSTTGDVIDRGEDSLECLKLVLEKFDYYIPGNHEILLLGGITLEPEYGNHLDIFSHNGGRWFLDLIIKNKGKHPLEVLKLELGETNFNKFIQNGRLLPSSSSNPDLYRKIGNIILVHAGINPNINSLDEFVDWVHKYNSFQLVSDHPLWIRDNFFKKKDSFFKDDNGDDIVVVHGHSFEHWMKHDNLSSNLYSTNWPVGYSHIDGYRLGIDTGSFETNCLSAVILENERYRIINSK